MEPFCVPRPFGICTGLCGALGGLIGIPGCSLTGTWKNVAVSPADAQFPISHVTFDAGKQFTATSQTAGGKHTSTGTYTRSTFGFKMTVTNDRPFVLTGRRRLDGKLTLTLGNGHPIVGTFEQTKE